MRPLRRQSMPLISTDQNSPLSRRFAVVPQIFPVSLRYRSLLRVAYKMLGGHGRHGDPCGQNFLRLHTKHSGCSCEQRDKVRLCPVLNR